MHFTIVAVVIKLSTITRLENANRDILTDMTASVDDALLSRLSQRTPSFTARATCAGKDGYASVNGRCYYLDSTPCTWYEAKQRCVLRGGSLVEIRNSRVHDDVKTVLRQSRSSAAQFWIGLTRGSWNWSTGQCSDKYPNVHRSVLIDYSHVFNKK